MIQKNLMLNKNKAIVFAMALFFALYNHNTTAKSPKKNNLPTASLRFALSDQHGFPLDEAKTNFDCLDKIYSVTELTGFEKGKHTVEFKWFEPNGSIQERTVYDFWVRDKPSTKLWAWLELSRARGAGMLQWLNPAAGLEEFIGNWELRLLIDGKQYNSGNFEVSC